MNTSVFAKKYATNSPKYYRLPSVELAPVVVLPMAGLCVDKSTECHVTPEKVCNAMAHHLDIDTTDRILEPSAGTGNLYKAVIKNCPNVESPLLVEKDPAIFGYLRANTRGQLINSDFLRLTADKIGLFDKVIMNPPFSRGKALAHVKHAQRLLKHDGFIIALVPASFKMDGMHVLELLPTGTFKTAPSVRTKVIKVWAL